MSFLRPTESSLRRTQTTLEAQQRQTITTSLPPSTSGDAPPPSIHPAPHDRLVPDYTRVPSRVDSGLHSRVQTSSLSRRRGRSDVHAELPTHSSSLRDFSSRCDHVMQRAQELLDGTREQEVVVVKALEERLSQSPARRSGTPTPPLSQDDATAALPHTPAQWARGLPQTSATSPALPAAPHTTPVAMPRTTAQEKAAEVRDGEAEETRWPRRPSPSPTRHGIGEWFGLRASSPSLPPLPAPPPTPAEAQRGATAAVAADASPGTERLGSPSFLQRLRQTLQRTPGSWSPPPPPPTPLSFANADASPVPSPPHAVTPSWEVTRSRAGQSAHASPRKSVKFVSPDKLESVTPTKMVVFNDSECDSDASSSDEESERESDDAVEAARTSTQLPPAKKARTEAEPLTLSPRRASTVLPPAPPPSAVKSPTRRRADGEERSRGSSSRVPSTSPPSPSTASQRTRSPRSSSSLRVSTGRGGSRASLSSRSASSSSAESAASARAYTMHHDELKAYVMQHTIRQSLAYLRKKEMKAFLREEGSPLARQHHVLKKRLLTEIRAILRKQAAAAV